MSDIGYAWIQDAVGAPDFLGAQRARLASVTRIERQPDGSLLVPHKLAPEPSLGQHALFALKHEGVHLALLLSAYLVGKLAWEQRFGALPLSGDMPIVVDAHLYGSIGGAVAGFILWVQAHRQVAVKSRI